VNLIQDLFSLSEVYANDKKFKSSSLKHTSLNLLALSLFLQSFGFYLPKHKFNSKKFEMQINYQTVLIKHSSFQDKVVETYTLCTKTAYI